MVNRVVTTGDVAIGAAVIIGVLVIGSIILYLLSLMGGE